MEESERYHDMCKIMRELVLWTYSKQIDLTIDERNLLSVAFNNVIGTYRLSWRILSRHEKMEDIIIIAYRKQVESDLECIIMNMIDLLENYLIKTETKVYYLKMAGDYYRYLAEFFTEKGYEKKALNFYKLALEICENEFPPTNSFRLGLVLNYSVCYYEMGKDKNKACELARDAFDKANSRIYELLGEGSEYVESTKIMQFLRDNLTLWTSDTED